MSQTQIAEELGMSQMHVSRLLARSLAQLRSGMVGRLVLEGSSIARDTAGAKDSTRPRIATRTHA